MKIFLIRHGESTSDVEDRYGGDYDDHLTARGKRQAEQLAKKLTDSGIEIIFSSPRSRARETAEIVAKALGCRLEIVNDLRERNLYGILTGMKKADAKKKYPEQVRLLEDFRNTLKSGEPYDDFKKRVIKSFESATNSKYTTIAVVTHGGPIKCIFREILNMDEVRNLEDCEILEIEKGKNKFSLMKTDDSFYH